MRIPAVVSVALLALPLAAQQHPRDKEIHDADTRAWWHTTEDLSNDGMEGRDTGSAAYQRAAEYVAARFKAAGLQPAGEGGGYFQTLQMMEHSVVPDGTSVTVHRPTGDLSFKFLDEITVTVGPMMAPTFQASMTFRGYCGKETMQDIAGKIVVCFGTQRQGLPNGADRLKNAHAGKAVGLIHVDDPDFTIEPPRWPAAYARAIGVVETTNEKAGMRPVMPPPAPRSIDGKPFGSPILTSMRISDAAFVRLLAGTGHDAAAILKLGGTKEALSSFDIAGTFEAHLHQTHTDIRSPLRSPNVLAVLPGSDPKLKDEYVVVGAHLDGYGFGTSVKGDSLYNGTLDDAAYVALLIQMADDIKSGTLPRPKRSILFCAFTGEEKGLLGSNWFVKHPTVPLAQMVADVNLDQLRPLFPLKILTAEALGESTLGDTARSVGKPMGIEIRPDMEPERGLLRRADQFPFLQAHVPAISFIFGYDPGTEAERRYREWYQVRYHRPQDDLTQPMDFDAAAKFDTFFYTLVEAVANAPEKPAFVATSPFAVK